MGLDMYLTAERYFSPYLNDPAPTLTPNPIPDGFELRTITVQVGYWRKANQIHNWFVKNVQDGEDECRPHNVSLDQIQDLINLATGAIKTQDPTLLPPSSGFFFGGTEIDEWYWFQLKNTVDQLTKVLASFPAREWNFTYRSSW